jgi:hypothetical protein
MVLAFVPGSDTYSSDTFQSVPVTMSPPYTSSELPWLPLQLSPFRSSLSSFLELQRYRFQARSSIRTRWLT